MGRPFGAALPENIMSKSMPRRRQHLYYMYGQNRCPGCKERKSYEDMTVDHIIPRSKGGTDRWENLQLMCGPCNVEKGNKIVA